MGLMAANEESDPSAILNGFWVTLFFMGFNEVSGGFVPDRHYFSFCLSVRNSAKMRAAVSTIFTQGRFL